MQQITVATDAQRRIRQRELAMLDEKEAQAVACQLARRRQADENRERYEGEDRPRSSGRRHLTPPTAQSSASQTSCSFWFE